MPTLDELKKFKTRIDQLGNEPEILASRGEKIADLEDIAPPAVTEAQTAETPTDEADSDIEDMDTLLSSYTDDLGELDKTDSFEDFDKPDDEEKPDEELAEEPPVVDESQEKTSPVSSIQSYSLDIEESPEDSQQFSLEDFGDEFSSIDEDKSVDEVISQDDIALPKDDFSDSGDEDSSFSLEEDEFQRLQNAINNFPQNLKLVIESFLGDDRWEVDTVKEFIDAILKGESLKSLVHRYYSITKRRIILPRRYKKQSGEFFEKRRALYIYQLFNKHWPLLQKTLLVVGAVWIMGLSLFTWVYRPLVAEILYTRGLDSIAMDEKAAAVDSFNDAWNGWPLFTSSDDDIGESPIVVKGWKNKNRWLDYARAFRKRKYWDEAADFYSGYLAVKPDAIDERIEFGRFLYDVLGKHESAIQVLESSSKLFQRHPELILAAGDVYLDWADTDPSRYENARLNYARALERARKNERAILSMMRYHLRLKNRKEVYTLLPIFNDEVPGDSSEPELAGEVFSSLAEFHLEEENMDEAHRFITLAEHADPAAPEPFYVSALYWRLQGNEQAELSSLQQTLINLDRMESLKHNHIKMQVLTLGGIGILYSEQASRLSPDSRDAGEVRSMALDNLNRAVNLYSDAHSRKILAASPEYGSIFLGFGNFLYQTNKGESEFSLETNQESLRIPDDSMSNLWLAEHYYNRAEELYDRGNGSSNLPDRALYRRAYVRHLLGMDGAVADFHRISRRRPDDYNSRLALAAVLLDSGDYEASRIQYQRSIELLDEELNSSMGILDFENKSAHRELFIRYVAAWNNLGVSQARSAAGRGGRNDDYAAALSAFTTASEFLDRVTIDQTALNSRGVTGLRDDNSRRIVERIDGLNFLKEKATLPHHNRLILLGKNETSFEETDYLAYSGIPSDFGS